MEGEIGFTGRQLTDLLSRPGASGSSADSCQEPGLSGLVSVTGDPGLRQQAGRQQVPGWGCTYSWGPAVCEQLQKTQDLSLQDICTHLHRGHSAPRVAA